MTMTTSSFPKSLVGGKKIKPPKQPAKPKPGGKKCQ